MVSVIRQRIGVTNFVAKLDEVRASDTFTLAYTSEHYQTPDFLFQHTLKACSDEKLGHRYWYDPLFVQLFNNVYFSLQKQILELVVSEEQDETKMDRFSRYENLDHFNRKGKLKSSIEIGNVNLFQTHRIRGRREIFRIQKPTSLSYENRISKLYVQ